MNYEIRDKAVFLPVPLNLFLSSAQADLIKLKGGRIAEGIIKSEGGDFVELEIEAGVVKFAKSQILTKNG